MHAILSCAATHLRPKSDQPISQTDSKEFVKDGATVALCLPRNNGIEYMDIFAVPDLALSLFDSALDQCAKSYWQEVA